MSNASKTVKPSRPDFKDISGKSFGNWTVISFNRIQWCTAHWNCQCACGTERVVSGKYLKNGNSKSCGCLKASLMSKMLGTHHLTGTTEHRIWKGIKTRCLNKNNRAYVYYGGRGIRICEKWSNSFVQFLSDVGNRPSEKHSLGRINNDGNYEPGNVRWETEEQQRNNTSSNRFFVVEGTRMTLAQVSRLFGIDRRDIGYRIDRKGMTFEQAIACGPRKT